MFCLGPVTIGRQKIVYLGLYLPYKNLNLSKRNNANGKDH